MGGIVGSGIFINPYVVARRVHTPFLILGAWAAGGAIALLGSFIYAELAERRPEAGGQYAYIREAYHPRLAFAYGWGLLLVTQSGGMAAVAVTFARYAREAGGLAIGDAPLAATTLALLTVINALGVRAGSALQGVLMLLKIAAIAGLVGAGLLAGPRVAPVAAAGLLDRPLSWDLLTAFGSALVPVLFAYGGWQTACFVGGEVRSPERNLPRGLLLGVSGVVALYLSVNLVCLRVLGPAGLASTLTPASDVMRQALGDRGALFIAAGIAVSTLGFLSQSLLTAPRVYYAMARDGDFLPAIGRVHPRTRVPIAAIALQGAWAIVIALSGRYEQILSYVVAVDWIFFGLAASCVFALRRKDGDRDGIRVTHPVPGHPFTTGAFILTSALVVANTLVRYPRQAAVGVALLLTAIPIHAVWRWKENRWPRHAS